MGHTRRRAAWRLMMFVAVVLGLWVEETVRAPDAVGLTPHGMVASTFRADTDTIIPPGVDTSVPPDSLPPGPRDSMPTGGDSIIDRDSIPPDTSGVTPGAPDPVTDWPIVTPPVPPSGSGVDFSSVMTSLRGQAMGMIKGCNYTRYLRLADSLAGALASFRSLDGGRPGRRWAAPFIDPISMLFRGAGTMASRKTAQAAQSSLAYQLEQVCNAVVQADQLRRQFALLASSTKDIEKDVNWLLNNLETAATDLPGARVNGIVSDWTRLFTAAAPRTGSPSDSMWEMIDTTVRNTFSATQGMRRTLDSLFSGLQSLKSEQLTFAWEDSVTPGVWRCPERMRDPNLPGTPVVGGRRVCGPAAPERQPQIMAPQQAIIATTKLIDASATIRTTELEGIRLMSDNERWRITALNRNASFTMF